MNRIIARPRKGCIFCGASPTTLEHLVPEWASKVLVQTKPAPSQPGRRVVGLHKAWTEGADADVDHEWFNPDSVEFTAKCVCAECNHGWMEHIESAAQNLITAMIEDRPTALDTKEQEAVATWLALKSLIARHGFPPRDTAFEWTGDFALNKRPPMSWHIRIARYEGTTIVSFGKRRSDTAIIHRLLPFIMKRPGFLFTAQLGRFVGQVVAIRQGQWVVPSPRAFIQIWPHPLLRANSPAVADVVSITWPPESWLGDSDLKKCLHDPSEPKEEFGVRIAP